MGVPLQEIVQALQTLPAAREPGAADWQRLSRRWHGQLSERIALLERLRDDLGSCIGCGCLSLKRCRLFNPGDQAAAGGDGPRFLLGPAPRRRS
jgi:MerR family redox-sensitive transcriptional activator SoxR